jgi:LemA protein
MELSIVVLAIVALLALFLITTYNRLVTLRQRVREAWSDIDVQLKRRHDLIPNLVETVKGYAGHERQTLESVTQARTAAVQASGAGPEQRAQAENMLTAALRQLFALAEAYPQLRAVESFNQLQEELTATEDKISFARRFYNGNVRDYNTALMTFPTNTLAGMFGFTSEQYFEVADAAERAVPQVKFTT